MDKFVHLHFVSCKRSSVKRQFFKLVYTFTGSHGTKAVVKVVSYGIRVMTRSNSAVSNWFVAVGVVISYCLFSTDNQESRERL